ncbi:hypothetical protein [Anaeromicropila herbilytica]|uniref:Peptidase C39-like domain-containing protein n=1 Tax=Anaeromicropila herbilytica TaxID=2785025 RepID=A0A7R7EIH7_9FIRM|nr:hypothetical protein [Anaeromicropila herbilytica]BCN29471.1 hypothetical protein bsdtb5_07660 [Anaeromicropila herbilytica]
MKLTIQKPELFTIVDNLSKNTSFGGNQAWYHKSWNQKSGCGPTCAANITAYLAHTRKGYEKLYKSSSMEKSDFLQHMNDLFEYITPGPMGVNTIDKFLIGARKFAEDRGVQLEMKALSVDKSTKKLRSREELVNFLEEAFHKDAPIAFLNLSVGEETRLQNWHWITITEVEIWDDTIMAIASDEGDLRVFDLLLWYQTTKMHGGLIYFA